VVFFRITASAAMIIETYRLQICEKPLVNCIIGRTKHFSEYFMSGVGFLLLHEKLDRCSEEQNGDINDSNDKEGVLNHFLGTKIKRSNKYGSYKY